MYGYWKIGRYLRCINEYCDEIFDVIFKVVIHDCCNEIDFTMGTRLISDDKCTAVREFVSDVVEKTYNPEGLVDYEVILHNLGGSLTEFDGTRNEILSSIDDETLFKCGNSGDANETDYDGALQNALIDLVGSTYSVKKIIMMSFCQVDDGLVMMIHVM